MISDSEIYFPLEANDEQQRIVTNLETRNGVLSKDHQVQVKVIPLPT